MNHLLDMINYLPYIPIGLFFFIAAIVCGVKGAKRGPVRALLSVLLTLCSALLAFAAVRLASAPLIALADKLSGEGVLSFPFLPEAAQKAAGLMIQAGANGLLFGLFFAIIALLIKCIVNAIIDKVRNKGKNKEEIKAARKGKTFGFKLSGALISILLDAVLITALLFLPLYGTLARVSQSMKTAADTSLVKEAFEGQETLVKGLGVLADNPALAVTRTEPVSYVMDQLFSASDQEDNISLESLWHGIQGILENLDAYMDSQGDDMTVNRRMGAAVSDLLGENRTARKLLIYAASEKIGDMLRETPYASSVSGILQAFDGDVAPENKEAEQDSFALLAGVARRMIAKGQNGGASEEDPSGSEGAGDTLELIGLAGDLTEALARHPNIGPQAAMTMFKDLASSMGEEMSSIFSDAAMLVFSAELKKSISRPAGEGRFGDFLKTAYLAVNAFSNLLSGEGGQAFTDLLLADKTLLSEMVDLLTPDFFTGMGMSKDAAEKAAAVGGPLFSAIVQTEMNAEKAQKEANYVSLLMKVIMDPVVTKGIAVILSNPIAFLEADLNSELINRTLKIMNDQGIGISEMGTPLTGSLKSTLHSVIGAFVSSQKSVRLSVDAQEKLNLLASFFGIEPFV